MAEIQTCDHCSSFQKNPETGTWACTLTVIVGRQHKRYLHRLALRQVRATYNHQRLRWTGAENLACGPCGLLAGPVRGKTQSKNRKGVRDD